MYSDKKKNVANIPNEIEKATVLPAENAGMRKNCSGIIAWSFRRSQLRNETSNKAEPTIDPMITGSPQPSWFASISP
jgi:hypothetical protein